MKILIVDDSVTFRTAIKTALANEPGIDIVGSASNGKIAIQKLKDTHVDLMILDLEMPEMDGVETLKALAPIESNLSVIIFAAPTASAYDKVRQALKSGADEFLAKPISSAEEGGLSGAIEKIRMDLVPRIRLLGARKAKGPTEAIPKPLNDSSNPAKSIVWSKRSLEYFKPDAIVIASSTGGPMALEALFEGLKLPIRVPIFVVQHMPPPFTKSLADRLQIISGIPAAEAQQGERVTPGKIYVAPANHHMSLIVDKPHPRIHLSTGPRINFVIPAADPLFDSAAEIYGSKLLAFVLTGMGEDAKLGSCNVKRKGGAVIIQDEATSVVWGMPGAVYEAKAFDEMYPLKQCGEIFKDMAQG